MALFRGQPVDRPAVKLWNVRPRQALLNPAFAPVHRAGIEQTDLMVSADSPFCPYAGRFHDQHFRVTEQAAHSPDWVDVVTTVSAPAGELRSVFRRSTRQRPGYEKSFLLKVPEDIKTLLSLPYEPYPFNPRPYADALAEVGDAGVAVFGLDHAMYALQRLIGSENFAVWNLYHDDLLEEAIACFAARIEAQVRAVLDHGLRPIFGWVGPELCIPPLMAPRDFDRYVMAYDMPLCDLIHDAGGLVWVHCHGRMGPVLERFLAMGVDVLNPIEPPPMGDVTLEEAFSRVGGAMALEGNIETHDLMTAAPEELTATIAESMAVGTRAGRRFILCPTSGYMENPEPTPEHIRNLLLYIQEGVRLAELAR